MSRSKSSSSRTPLLSGVLAFVIAGTALTPFAASAQGVRSYHYVGIGVTYTVHADSTVAVHEAQTYEFTGAYHEAERIVPHKGSDAITDITVTDTTLGTNLVYAGTMELDKTDPNAWGKYTVREEGGNTIIDWYYNLADTDHSWNIDYTLHGAISFYKDHDELYWNLFDSYTVPVDHVEAIVELPGPDTLPTATLYVNGNHNVQPERFDDKTFSFTAYQFVPHESVTVAVGWQKGLVSEAAYRHELFMRWFSYLFSAFVLIAAVLFSLIHWYFTERYHAGRGTIVPQYEPPEHLPPAMAELIVKERLTKRAWPATVIDLAVRGYVRIEEEPRRWYDWGGAVILGAVAIMAVGLVGDLFFNDFGGPLLGAIVAILLPAILVIALLNIGRLRLIPKYYRVVSRIPGPASGTLRRYEQIFLDVLFPHGETVFSTRTMQYASSSVQRSMHDSFERLKKELRKETDDDTHAYSIGLSRVDSVYVLGAALALSPILVICVYAISIDTRAFQYVLPVISVVIACVIVANRLYVNARLNKEGQILREDWLGFKLYLETAERYRMQNLTPDLFEKYLPYAIIFGIEKKWASAFDTMNLQAPAWYGGGYYAVGSGNTGSFSPVSFTSSFSASFSTSFTSAGGGGGFSGGGGFAGGGGGGGGGGAS